MIIIMLTITIIIISVVYCRLLEWQHEKLGRFVINTVTDLVVLLYQLASQSVSIFANTNDGASYLDESFHVPHLCDRAG